MKSVLTSIQPYYVFLIIAHTMGWNIPQQKTVEVRKNFPKAPNWDKRVIIYCGKNRRSFRRIPKEYQPLMTPFLGKVIGEFVCDRIDEFHEWQLEPYGKFAEFEEEELQEFLRKSCLSYKEVCDYRRNLIYCKPLFVWHISDLKIYDQPKELGEFKKGCNDMYDPMYGSYCGDCEKKCYLKRAPQSWQYVEV